MYIYTYKNKEYSEQEILDLLKQENKSFWNRLTRTGLGLLTPETKEAILNEANTNTEQKQLGGNLYKKPSKILKRI